MCFEYSIVVGLEFWKCRRPRFGRSSAARVGTRKEKYNNISYALLFQFHKLMDFQGSITSYVRCFNFLSNIPLAASRSSLKEVKDSDCAASLSLYVNDMSQECASYRISFS